MHPSQLIGKKAVRTKPVVRVSISILGAVQENKDNSFTTEPIRILAVTEGHIIYQYSEDTPMGRIDKGEKRLLNSDYLDNHWTDYDELMKLADPKHIEMMQQLVRAMEQKEDKQEDN